MPRLFTALEIPRDAALSLSLLRGGLPGARWIDVENYHITLRFIGDVEGHVADEVANALDRVRRPEFMLNLSGVDAFGSKKPHSIYAGVSPSPELNALQGEIERICQRLGIPADPRKFTPHVTLARLRNPRIEDVVHYLSSRGNFSTLPFKVGRFVLMSSRDSVGGGPYIVEEAWPLMAASRQNWSANALEDARTIR
ncbi:RNA 2',3'-cyclic phosphodiesterase [Brucella pituitosa]|uniref:RNA 2',3'-cyclic phosphodiesterase n=1 Tax=Brucella pituitosa TaxID=571256 RepID=A0A643F3Q6_9HYPH|nr:MULTISPECIES: RNA 2',3'-cyclic phosphodiesterase [Brucella]PQZ49126.1 RNA 2',3'-cyclic phosphodiesterase [Ochrobactrum sp. MYb19]PRA57669.1 RNA 2',3'-cyclic phosphodiesterase [Ochrobactrum sp. MYb68]PRA67056.1 RNA 2',3'-cyclic phosphodiesterase [Ochrobactrum sp. MYb18]PRA75914.1 RNA 2',3'-cyclic phosphodiesterase [Brucella thiophenivorans]PRA88913.1 RNA 2',3'-cyclic phosphodiesterase [Ochrobactrum sp. MYb29]PRA92067.1 RNA 2',3'-cyclic phosphodiesterase [Ochrobactrum sp. MYb14]PRA97920.1 R